MDSNRFRAFGELLEQNPRLVDRLTANLIGGQRWAYEEVHRIEKTIEEISSCIQGSRGLATLPSRIAITKRDAEEFCRSTFRPDMGSVMLESYRSKFRQIDGALALALAKKAEGDGRMRALWNAKFETDTELSELNTQVDSAAKAYILHTEGRASKDKLGTALSDLKGIRDKLADDNKSSSRSKQEDMLRQQFATKVSSAIDTLQTYWDGLPKEASTKETDAGPHTGSLPHNDSATFEDLARKWCKFTEAQRLLWSCQSTLMYAVTAFKVSQDDEALKEFARRFKPAYDQLQDASERLSKDANAIPGHKDTIESIKTFWKLVSERMGVQDATALLDGASLDKTTDDS